MNDKIQAKYTKIKELKNQNLTTKQISDMLGISKTTVRNVVKHGHNNTRKMNKDTTILPPPQPKQTLIDKFINFINSIFVG